MTRYPLHPDIYPCPSQYLWITSHRRALLMQFSIDLIADRDENESEQIRMLVLGSWWPSIYVEALQMAYSSAVFIEKWQGNFQVKFQLLLFTGYCNNHSVMISKCGTILFWHSSILALYILNGPSFIFSYQEQRSSNIIRNLFVLNI